MKIANILTSNEVAELLKISTRTLQRRRDAGAIEFIQDGPVIRYKMDHVIEYMNRNTVALSRSYQIEKDTFNLVEGK